MVTDRSGPHTFKYKAKCPHCGDASFPSSPIKGNIYIGHTDYTVCTGSDTETDREGHDVIVFRTAKVKQYE